MSSYRESHNEIPQASAVRGPASFRLVAGAGHVVSLLTRVGGIHLHQFQLTAVMVDPQVSAVRGLASFRGGRSRADELRWPSAVSGARLGAADQEEALQPRSLGLLGMLLSTRVWRIHGVTPAAFIAVGVANITACGPV